MIIVKIIGGLGNQMFQYAYAKKLETLGYEVKIDISCFDNYTLHGGFRLKEYNITLPIAENEDLKKAAPRSIFSKIAARLSVSRRYLREKTLLFDEKLLSPAHGLYIEGYFQSENYFLDIRDILRKEFQMKPPMSKYAKMIEKEIVGAQNSVSIHVRRGDYISNEEANVIHGTCAPEYYESAVDTLLNNLKETTFFVFSDDIGWAKDNLEIDNAVYITDNDHRLPHEDIYLMSRCKHNIIANSSFSWWAAWLNNNSSKTVIAPRRWFADEKKQSEASNILPENWIKL